MLRSIIFDLDRTLLDRDKSILSFASSQFEAFRHRLEGIDSETYVSTFVRLDARGSVWKDEVYHQLTSELRIRSVSADELFADFDSRISDHYLPFPDLHEILGLLATTYQLGLITNGRTQFQRRTIEALDIGRYFRVTLISEAEGLRKPQVEIFHRALKKLDVQPNEAAYVGDHPVTDIQGARDAGMATFWKRNSDFASAPCDVAFDDLCELPAKLGAYRRGGKGTRP